jgi:lipopolysaccharide heptosyltransferase II
MNLMRDSTSDIKSILVVGKNNQIGDMICSLPLYAALKKRFPKAKITLVAAKTNYPVPLKEINPHLDKIIIYDKSSLKTVYKFYRELKRVRPDIGITPSTFANSTTSHIINFISGAKIRVGVNSIDEKINKSAILLNVKNDFYWDKENKHQSERNLDVIRSIGCDLDKAELQKIRLELSEDDNVFAENFINKKFPDDTKVIIGIHPGAGKKDNIWPVEKFIELISSLHKNHDSYILLTSGWTDKEILTAISARLVELNIAYEVAENLEIKRLAAVLSRIDLYVTNDTGTMHIAGSVGTKMISLFGPTKYYEWAPPMEHHIQSLSGNIDDIAVSDVIELSNKILKKSILRKGGM